MSMNAVSGDQRSRAATERSVTILGATGSIGASTIDLIKRERSQYRVEAVSAHRNAGALATLARELNASFAAVGDPAAYGDLKEALAGTGIEAGAGESALVEAAARPAQSPTAARRRSRRCSARTGRGTRNCDR